MASWGGVCSEKNTVVIEMKSPNGQFYNVAVSIYDLKKENNKIHIYPLLVLCMFFMQSTNQILVF